MTIITFSYIIKPKGDFMKNSSTRLIPSADELELRARKRRITEIVNSDNYIEQMQEINNELNATRTNKKVINYRDIKKIFDSREGEDGKQ